MHQQARLTGQLQADVCALLGRRHRRSMTVLEMQTMAPGAGYQARRLSAFHCTQSFKAGLDTPWQNNQILTHKPQAKTAQAYSPPASLHYHDFLISETAVSWQRACLVHDFVGDAALKLPQGVLMRPHPPFKGLHTRMAGVQGSGVRVLESLTSSKACSPGRWLLQGQGLIGLGQQRRQWCRVGCSQKT